MKSRRSKSRKSKVGDESALKKGARDLANGALADKAALNTTIKTAIEHIRKTYEI
jgi:phage shock protein A